MRTEAGWSCLEIFKNKKWLNEQGVHSINSGVAIIGEWPKNWGVSTLKLIVYPFFSPRKYSFKCCLSWI